MDKTVKGGVATVETYSEFLARINSFEKKSMELGGGDFKVSPSVALKVDKDNSFREFYGDTTVFALDAKVKTEINKYVDRLYRAVPQCFCERLAEHTYHVTLHDLGNSPKLSDVAEEVFCNELKIMEKRDELRRIAAGSKIAMKSKYVFNMVNTSLVLGLYPASESDYDKLMRAYSVIDDVKKLSYPLTPHITLAYYNVDGFDNKSAKALEKAVNDINAEIDMQFDIGKLYYQKFVSMNGYVDIAELS